MEWNEALEALQGNEGFAFGVIECETMEEVTPTVRVLAKVDGRIRVGDTICFTNVGDDDAKEYKTKVLHIRTIDEENPEMAEDTTALIILDDAIDKNIKVGTIMYSEDLEIDIAEKHKLYFTALGDHFLAAKNMELTDADFDKLNCTDCAEIWRLSKWYFDNPEESGIDNTTEEAKEKYVERQEKIRKAIAKKLLEMDSLYYLHNTYTGEAHLLSRTVKDGEKLMCTVPQILVTTKAYKEYLEAAFPGEDFQITEVKNGDNKNGIKNFFLHNFYTNGADAVEVIVNNLTIRANEIIEKPEAKDDGIISNPSLVKWMLLLNQNEKVQGEVKSVNEKMYFNMMVNELKNAKFLLPMKIEKQDGSKIIKDGQVALKEGDKMIVPSIGIQNSANARPIFTDWYRMRKMYGSEWGGTIQTIEQVASANDCIINAGRNKNATGVIKTEFYEKIKNN